MIEALLRGAGVCGLVALVVTVLFCAFVPVRYARRRRDRS
jgi:hypothetical protein